MPNEEVFKTGFFLAAFAWTIWWNLDWRRFIKFYVSGGPPYRSWIEIGARIFLHCARSEQRAVCESYYSNAPAPLGFI